jgi:cation diffusion facilitator CzcD-associated flavoprotein CzcO
MSAGEPAGAPDREVPAPESTWADTVVIGASAAGLATAAMLRARGIAPIVLEQHAHVGHAWRHHYDRLHLHTSKGLSHLPGLGFGRDVPRYATRDQVVRYLERYAAHHGIAPRFGTRVLRIRRAGDAWRTETTQGTFASANVVVATGFNQEPHVPSWPGQDAFNGKVLHSSAYRSGVAFRGERVLVVGFGNSGGEIAIDLHEQGAFPTLAVRSAVNVVPRDLFGIPILAIGIVMSKLPPRLADAVGGGLVRLVVGDLESIGLRRLPHGVQQQIREHGRIPLLDVGTIALARQGAIAIRPGIARFTPSGVAFTDGRAEDFDAVVLATGYRPRLDGILEDASAVLDARGLPRRSGGPTELRGLYFCGFYLSPQGMLREIGAEAKRIARAIRAGAAAHPSARV